MAGYMAANLDTWWRRVGKVLALLGLAMLGMLDVAIGQILGFSGVLAPFAALAQVTLAIGAAGVWLLARRLGPDRLIQLALLVAGLSVTTTVVDVYVARGGALVGLYDSGSGGIWGLAESCALFGVAFALARWARPAPAAFGILVTGLAVAIMPLRTGVGGPSVIVGLAAALLATVAAGAGMYYRLVAAARERQLATVRAEQRAEFARDLHDFIAHHVTGIVVQAQGARYVADSDPRRAVEALEQIERAGAETMAAMRRMVGVLRGHGAAPSAPLAVLADVPALVEDFTAAGPVKAYLQVEGGLDDLPVDVSSSGYRVVMEALTNVRQHARGAQRVEVWISRTATWLLIRVTNDGPAPHDRPGHGGFGLAGLSERVGALGGRLRAEPDIEGGWVVDATIPLESRGRR